jgi:7-cyano-7-deazaguanine synthase
VVIGTLEHNPFPDATPEFRSTLARALSLGLAHDLRIDAPYAGTSKAGVVRRGVALGVPFDLTLSCMAPQRSGPWSGASDRGSGSNSEQSGQHRSATGHWPPATAHYIHCGKCSKCRERHDAFVEAGIRDPTEYADTANLT